MASLGPTASLEAKQKFRDESFWQQQQERFRSIVATGKLPLDAFNVVMSPVMATIHAGPVKAAVHGLKASMPVSEAMEKKFPQLSQSNMESSLMDTLIGIAPEKGAALSSAAGVRASSIGDLRALAERSYQVADQSGMRIKPEAIEDLHRTMTADLESKGYHYKLHPKSSVALEMIKNATEDGTPLSLQDVDILRKITGHAAGSLEPSDGFMGGVLRDHIDDFIDKLDPSHVTGGTMDRAAIDSLTTARLAWKRASKGEVIADAVDRAATNAKSRSSSTYEAGLRTEFRKIATSKRAMSRFSPQERAAIKKVAMGGPIANTLRFFGKFSPEHIWSAGAGATLAYEFGGPAAAMAVPVVGKAAEVGATMLTARNARLASEVVRGATPKGPLALAHAAKYLSPAAAASLGEDQGSNQ